MVKMVSWQYTNTFRAIERKTKNLTCLCKVCTKKGEIFYPFKTPRDLYATGINLTYSLNSVDYKDNQCSQIIKYNV